MIQDRLYGITLYLLNHKRVSATALAQRFEVSKRTIQRDIDRLCIAGIPIIAYTGVDGGYEIVSDYQMKNHLINESEHGWIMTALQALSTGFENCDINRIKEKYASLSIKNPPIAMDLTVSHEHQTSAMISSIVESIANQHSLYFSYTNQKMEQKEHMVEPIGCQYLWYHWYLIGYDVEQKDYRMYKLIRMQKLEELHRGIGVHPSLQMIVEGMMNNKQPLFHIVMKCDQIIKNTVLEYFQGNILREEENYFLFEMEVGQDEHVWFAMLLRLGDHIDIVEPDHLRIRILAHCEQVVKRMKR